MIINLYNTADRKKEKFLPIHEGHVGIYTCGPTVYDRAHIGNLRAYVFADILKKMFEFNGYIVKHVMNITDVGHLVSDADTGEDKVEKSAREKHKTAWEISQYFTNLFFQDTQKLNISRPTIVCKATDHIQDMIHLVETLEKKGYTYKTNDGIYFDTSKFKDYGKFARLNVKFLKPGIRVPLGEKRNPTDFALWKFSGETKRQMEWDSPFGKGFPGWHIECSAMSMKYLGNHFDIHTGGIDHIPVHHTNEIAQSEAATGEKFVNYWMHVAFLTVDGKKMSKSAGTFITLDDVVNHGINPLSLRYFYLGTSYRKTLDFTWEKISKVDKEFASLRKKVEDILANTDQKKVDLSEAPAEYLDAIHNSINNDLDTRSAIISIKHLINDSNVNDEQKWVLISKVDKIFGLGLSSLSSEIPHEVIALAEERVLARRMKEWKKADELRRQIESLGFEIADEEGYKYTIHKK
ncbi:MAG: cysteine--tRNA ligase [Candidatus Micrarchaeia archaeon]